MAPTMGAPPPYPEPRRPAPRTKHDRRAGKEVNEGKMGKLVKMGKGKLPVIEDDVMGLGVIR